jgi:hypothetical protein
MKATTPPPRFGQGAAWRALSLSSAAANTDLRFRHRGRERFNPTPRAHRAQKFAKRGRGWKRDAQHVGHPLHGIASWVERGAGFPISDGAMRNASLAREFAQCPATFKPGGP